jgi:hypothetical protein
MNKLLILALVLSILCLGSVSAVEPSVVNMKTNDFFIVQFSVSNSNNIDLRNCVPYMKTSDYALLEGVSFSPEIFDLPPGTSKTVSGRLDGLDVGYYEGLVNVKCERYGDGELVDVDDIIDPNVAPRYEILVSPAGEGQDYVFIPVQSYQFLSNGGETKTARFTIANTGDKTLSVDILPPAEYQDIISVSPRMASIVPGDRTSFQITVVVPEDFEGMETNLSITIGDYSEDFTVIGLEERAGLVGSAVAQNLLSGTVSAGTIKIPKSILLIIIIVATGFLFKDDLFKKKKKTKRGKKK